MIQKTLTKKKNKKKNGLFPKCQLIPILCLQVMHDYLHWHCSINYCVKINWEYAYNITLIAYWVLTRKIPTPSTINLSQSVATSFTQNITQRDVLVWQFPAKPLQQGFSTIFHGGPKEVWKCMLKGKIKWTPLSELFLYISMYSRGDQQAEFGPRAACWEPLHYNVVKLYFWAWMRAGGKSVTIFIKLLLVS